MYLVHGGGGASKKKNAFLIREMTNGAMTGRKPAILAKEALLW